MTSSGTPCFVRFAWLIALVLCGCLQPAPGPQLGLYIANVDDVPAIGNITVLRGDEVVLLIAFDVPPHTTDWVLEPRPADYGRHDVVLVLNGETHTSRRSFTGDTEGIKVLIHEGNVEISYLGMSGIYSGQ